MIRARFEQSTGVRNPVSMAVVGAGQRWFGPTAPRTELSENGFGPVR
ncbi:hypothetical protein SJ05684_c19700 [Sinorhizobium sojae CCBAU 05684]|uniref:Uncharacterized protein n=1 Tax=Sinorhizobium sojae CCBAU 05684 TaxID=716928 RepID=A0A249PCC1_9HYPH|nr:hypothetical protein SJ05684_c19700 [Sinorhizobium sojae CCBAU 05684]